MDSDLFTIVADRLCEFSDLSRLEARGTIRIAFKKAGVDIECFGLDDLEAILTKIMPGELENVGCADSQSICDAIMKSMQSAAPETATRSRDEIIRRLGSA
jgi:hypothetical protein